MYWAIIIIVVILVLASYHRDTLVAIRGPVKHYFLEATIDTDLSNKKILYIQDRNTLVQGSSYL